MNGGMYSGFETNTGDKKACMAKFTFASTKPSADINPDGTKDITLAEGITLDAPTVKRAGTNKMNNPNNPDDVMRQKAYQELKDAGCDFSGKGAAPVQQGRKVVVPAGQSGLNLAPNQ